MRKFTWCWVCVLIAFGMTLPINANAIGTNFRAQGHYYSAKDALEKKQYKNALDYVYKSKAALQGTNPELQYLHILSAYNAQRYTEAQKEMETFFALEEKKLKSVDFDKSVDQLTDDEVRALTMLMNNIDENAELERANIKKKKAENDANEQAAKDLSGDWVIDAPSAHTGSKTVLLTHDGDSIELKSPDVFTDGSGNKTPTLDVSVIKVSESDEFIYYTGKVYVIGGPYYCDGKHWYETSGWTVGGKVNYSKTKRTITFQIMKHINTDCNDRQAGLVSYMLRRQ